jgi:hypothetical protein
MQPDPRALEAAKKLTDEEILRQLFELAGPNPALGQLSLEIDILRQNAIDSPFCMATEIVDPAFYKKHFSERHKRLMDETLAPWCIGETAKINGISYDPHDYTGLLVLWSRSTYKSTMLRLLSMWFSVYMKLRKREDARQAFIHQVISKALEHSESIREVARNCAKWRECFPEFSPRTDIKDWDEIKKWRWPNFTSYSATEYSYTFYGETSSKTGGHYNLRLVDDWVTEDSVTGPEMLDQSERRFKAMDNLRDRTRPFNPWIVVGTTYHFHDTYARLERTGGWLVTKVPAHEGSPKAIFDLASLDDREEKDRKKIKAGLAKLDKERKADLNFPNLLPWRELLRSAVAQQADNEGGFGGSHQEYNCQLLLNPTPEGEQRFATSDLDQSWISELPPPGDMVLYIRCDPAISKKKESDETAINLGGVDWRGHRYYIDGWIGREKRPTEQVRKMFRLARSWQGRGYKVENIGVESVAYQEALAQLCRDGVPSREAEFDGEMVPILKPPCRVVSITRSTDMRKPERLLQMTGPVERHEVHIWTENPIGRKIYDGHKQFPYGKDDGLDTCHDFWIKARVPARSLAPDGRKMDPAFKKIMDRIMMRGGDSPKLTGLSHTTILERWGGK